VSSHFRISLTHRLLRRWGGVLTRIVYRIRTHGLENLPAGGFLLLPNHLTWVDAIVLQAAFPRPIRFVLFEPIYHNKWLHPFFKLIGAIPISPTRARESLRAAIEALEAGEVVCIFPEGELSRTGILLRLHRGYELVARAAGAPVVPVWLDQLWGSVFSFKGGRYFYKIPQSIPYPVTVAYDKPIPPKEADIATVRERFLLLGEFCYQLRPPLRGHLARAAVRGLKRRQFATAVIDGMDHSTISFGSLLAAAITLAEHLRKSCPGRRIGIVLPPGKAGVIANLAVVLANKTPVNLNFTAGREAVEAALRIGEIRDCLTAHAVQKRLPDFPWPANLLHVDDILPPLKKRIVAWRTAVAALPVRALCALLRLPKTGDHEEAIILFTSGSSGEPKGVVLSHRNVIANVSQIMLMLSLTKRDSILASLPFFHSFGSTVTLWYPLLEGVRIVTFPNALDLTKSAELIHKYGVTLLCSTPTFLRGYLRKATKEQLAPIKLLVTGAEKLPNELGAAFEKQFGHEVLQGYGLTETAPAAAFNLPAPLPSRPTDPVQPSSRQGSVGKLAPGIAAQIRDPETGARLSLHETGMLWLRGPNIFERYLNEPERTAEVLQDGWFRTGDLARFDEDGFLYIEGRLSRFSKIGGEMVPHETIESRLYEVLDLSKSERVIAVTSVPDEAKGEALVVLTTTDLDAAEVRKKLMDSGMANLWIPKKYKKVDAIPVLGTGKLDLKRCQELAREG
jgi:acyl-[acyl-carrier-protein]-phospholipid O-acyltransferase/long-chain-fatty-acid--[acyl-carrier-protein] ligase